MRRIILIGFVIEMILVVWGVSAFAIANYFNYKQDLILIKERQKCLKIKTVYKNCSYDYNEEKWKGDIMKKELKKRDYEVLKDRYLTLKRFLRLVIKEHILDRKNVECILNALDDEEILIDEIVEGE